MILTQRGTVGCYSDSFLPKCAAASTPFNTKIDLLPATDTEVAQLGSTPFCACSGAMGWIGLQARPEIEFAINHISRFSVRPGVPHWMAIKRVVHYLQGSKNVGLCFCRDTGPVGIFEAFSDANLAGCKATRRATSGDIIIMAGAEVSWLSRHQLSVSISSVESEYMALSQTARDIVWLRPRAAELGYHQLGPTIS